MQQGFEKQPILKIQTQLFITTIATLHYTYSYTTKRFETICKGNVKYFTFFTVKYNCYRTSPIKDILCSSIVEVFTNLAIHQPG